MIMAKRTSRAKRPDPRAKVIEVALAFAAEGRWRDLSLAEIAEAAKLPYAEVYRLFSSKQAILSAYSADIDAKVLAGQAADLVSEPARDRLFDVIMRRLDALRPNKAGLATIAQDTARDPMLAVCGGCRLRRSMAAMLEAADLSAEGLRGTLRVKGLAAVYLATLRIWFRDDSEDMGKTMAKLDSALRCIDRIIRCCRGRKPSAEAA
jgi:AcrR family transcriptional regulator